MAESANVHGANYSRVRDANGQSLADWPSISSNRPQQRFPRACGTQSSAEGPVPLDNAGCRATPDREPVRYHARARRGERYEREVGAELVRPPQNCPWTVRVDRVRVAIGITSA